jgi:hypothetical protein
MTENGDGSRWLLAYDTPARSATPPLHATPLRTITRHPMPEESIHANPRCLHRLV